SIRADDLLGNNGEVAIEIVVDNTPAQVELDPPKMRLGELGSGKLKCSQLFDPVGGESANDGQIVPQIITIKSRIEDRGNNAPGLLVERFSGIDAKSVALYVMPAVLPSMGNRALAVDTNGD